MGTVKSPSSFELPSLLLLLACLIPALLPAEGTPDLRTAEGDPVLLLLGDSNFGDFASYGSPESSRLNFRIAEAGEVVYFGFSRLYRSSGFPENLGQFEYRVRRSDNDEIVFGPVRVNSSNENLSSYEEAAAGPSALNPNGYEAGERNTFMAPAAGEYYIEFSRNSRRRARYIGLWDITVANNGVEQSARVYSKNWAFRVPEQDPELPLCAFGAELSTRFYSYTMDGFVTMIDFRNSGFQPLSFNLAFNRTGPGNTGNLLIDRQSVAEQNLTSNSAEHLIFLREPDPLLFPDGECGEVSVSSSLECQPNNTFCIPVSVTVPGQIQIVLDFDGNGVYDEATDRILAERFEGNGETLNTCVAWDGLLPDGNRPADGSTVDILVDYTQGVQHWALYDGELMRNGFCVTPIRPTCGDEVDSPLYYDDSQIPDSPGTGAPQRELNGCDCNTDNCRTWTFFETFADDGCLLDNDATIGYGDRNTLNTWWFARSQTAASLDVPLEVAMISGPEDFCASEGAQLELNFMTVNQVGSIRWTGPNGPIPAGDDQRIVTVTEGGMYEAVIIDEFGCESSAMYTLMEVKCMLALELLEVACDDNGTDKDPSDDTFTARLRVTGNNSAGWTGTDGATGAYGEIVELGPFLISGGPINFSATDNEFSCCTETLDITPPMSCSDGCAITVANILSTQCNDNGTPTDPDDDTFTFDVIIDGINLGSTWISDRGVSGSYGVRTTIGPFPIADGNQRFVFVDAADAGCVFTATVQPPRTCSEECALNPVVTNLLCDDNGTPFDSSDDNYTFDLTLEGINTPSVGYSFNGVGAFVYGQTYGFGPFMISMSTFSFELADMGRPDACRVTLMLEDPPMACSDACGITVEELMITCDEEREGGVTAYYVEALVSNQNPNSLEWVGPGGQRYPYGSLVRVATVNPGSGTYSLTAVDGLDPSCMATGEAALPEISIECPDDKESMGFPISTQTFGGTLSDGPNTVGADRDICWLADEDFSGGRRFQDRLTISRADTTSDSLALFSFYLLADDNIEVLGAVFSLGEGEELDCCNLTNDGPVRAEPTNPNSTPLLPDSLLPDGLVVQQRFSLSLRPRQNYTLITGSPLANQEGAFTWLILSPDGKQLEVVRAGAPDPVSTFDTVQITFDLLTRQIPDILNDTSSVHIFGTPTVTDLCGDFDFFVMDEEGGNCSDRVITRRFHLMTADTMLKDICTQELGFRALSIDDVIWPESGSSFGCGDTFPRLPNGNPAPLYTGYPYVFRAGVAEMLGQGELDELRVSYRDERITRPEDGGTSILRTWTIVDDCANRTETYTQTLKLDASGKPFFTCPIANHYCPIVEEDIMLFPTNAEDCTADIIIPEPELNNVCVVDNWTFTTEVLRLEENGDTTLLYTLQEGDARDFQGVGIGEYFIRYKGEHPTEEIEDGLCRFRIADTTEPVAICEDNVNVSMPGNGQLPLPVSVIDLGSYDNCSVELLEMRQLLSSGDSTIWSEWGPRVLLDCEDVGTNIVIEMRVIDLGGNVNFCTSNVLIKDNTLPYCTGLEATSVDCNELPDGFSPYDTTQLRMLFGLPEVVDNCSAEAKELEPIVMGDFCSPEVIRRRFQAIDQHGNLSAGLFFQDITVTPSADFAVRFPKDASTDCTDLVDTLRIVGSACDSITYAIVDVDLPIEGEECRFIQRNYVVTNWCAWDGESEPIRISRDEDQSGVEGDQETWLIRNADGLFVDADRDPDNTPAPFREITTTATGRYVYSQRLKIFDVTAPEITLTMLDTICVDTASCVVPVMVGIELFDACQVDEGQVIVGVDFNNNGEVEAGDSQTGELVGSFPSYTYTADFPIGEHRMVFTATDDCGNTSTTERIFRVNDCYVPELTCKEDRIYNLQPLVEIGDIDGDGEVEEAAVLIEAIDLASCEFPDCSGELVYSINRVGEPVDRDQNSLFLDCEDRYQLDVEVYVWDDAFNPFAVQPDSTIGGNNWRKCTVRVRVQDPNLACNNCQVENNITINGQVSLLNGTPIEEVAIEGGITTRPTMTNNFGMYQLGGTVGDDFILSASKEVDPREGLSTIDLVILQRHLLGIDMINNSFVRLAADVNRDNQINLQDLIHLRALILAKRELYPDGSPWRFVDADWNGMGFPPELILLENTENCGYDHDFIGLRLGDLNTSFGGDAGGAPSGRSRPVVLEAQDVDFGSDEEIAVSLRLTEYADLTGGQIALRWDDAGLELIDVESQTISPNGNVRTSRNYLWLNWSRELDREELLRLRFRTKRSGRLSDHLTDTEDSRLLPEVYNTDLVSQPLILSFAAAGEQPAFEPTLVDPEIVGSVPELLGVLPNPVRELTRIGLYVPSEQQAQVIVTDMAGRRVERREVTFIAGEQWIRLDGNAWPAGVYQFTVELIEGPVSGRLLRQ